MLFPETPADDAYLFVETPTGTHVLANRFNTTLYTFFGDLAVYNHVFVEAEPESNDVSDEPPGLHIFADNPLYPALFKLVIENDFPQMLNALNILDTEVEAYDLQHLDPVPTSTDDEVLTDWDTELANLFGPENKSE